MSRSMITEELIAKHGLTQEEYQKILTLLGREPSFEELGVFSVMWSEHCSYKNSRLELKKFPTTAPSVLVKAGEENAGVIDIGDGWAIAFKIESHNHPSAVEPFQGAATGVGGIIRDIFTMGARPAFLLNSLRFGPIQSPTQPTNTLTSKQHAEKAQDTASHPLEKTALASQIAANKRLFSGVVAGIAHYGNCMGIPTIGGEIYFDESYQANPLVNAFCLGVLRHDQIARGAAKGIGNPVFYVGAETGRDGLAGAAFASRELTEESKEDRPAVQVGDPFREKLLLEACLELLASGVVAGIQDMGAAGLTCSTCETASRGGTGVEIDLEKVPQRASDLSSYEILLSESQERMLVIVHAGQEAPVQKIFEKWGLPYALIGQVTDDGKMRVRRGSEIVVDVPARVLADEAPLYAREAAEEKRPLPLDHTTLTKPTYGKLEEALVRLLAHPSIASKRAVWEQYDHMVGTGTVVLPGSDAAVFYLKEAQKFLAATTDCNAIYCRLDPREGARAAVAEAARNLLCSGARPLGVTDNLNFGNPHKPENFLQLRAAVEGISEGCRAFEIPVTGGNVSLYNENRAGAIDPTPTVAMVGQIDREEDILRQGFLQAGDLIFLLGDLVDEEVGLGGSHYLLIEEGKKEGLPPRVDFAKEKELHQLFRKLLQARLIKSAHDCSEGGIAVALAEACFGRLSEDRGTLLGAKINLDMALGEAWQERVDQEMRIAIALFGEAQGRVLLSIDPNQRSAFEKITATSRVKVTPLGEVQQESQLEISVAGQQYHWATEWLYNHWSSLSLE